MRRLSFSKQMTLGAMVTALAVLCLYATAVLPAGSVPLYFLSSFVIYVLVCEGAYTAALVSFLASAVLAFFMLPNKVPVFAYIVLFGHFGIFRTAMQNRFRGKLMPAFLKLLYCDAFAGVGIYLALYVFNINLSAIPVMQLPVWALAVLSQLAFLFYDVLYSLSAMVYETRFRRIIVPRR